MNAATCAPLAADRLRPTLGNPAWLQRNSVRLRGLLPLVWTRASTPEFIVSFGVGLKLLGVNWLDNDDLLVAAHWLCHIGLGERLFCDEPLSLDRTWVRRGPGKAA